MCEGVRPYHLFGGFAHRLHLMGFAVHGDN
jgi:hypothetical protein